ncbi:MAG: hypothetical protein K6T63_09560 [Alicyclobacillus herbarius]|uniref:hypothetical protein n=1 Tax=Alicyclobacillus herbarius TaxID=122960 RepID=UPI0012DC2789|nr:hypothetical protein [Alicyclobacillus herbarius]MCL6632869.1 hypothetical protein [Alicyclobacillus herbarius]
MAHAAADKTQVDKPLLAGAYPQNERNRRLRAGRSATCGYAFRRQRAHHNWQPVRRRCVATKPYLPGLSSTPLNSVKHFA